MKKLKLLKLEWSNEKNIYIFYEKTDNGDYECSVYLETEDEADLHFCFGSVFPQEAETGVCTSTDEAFEEDISRLAINYVMEFCLWT